MTRRQTTLAVSFLLLASPLLPAADDVALKAMRDELQRSMTLQFNALEKPYYLEYLMEDGHRVQVSAVLDGIVNIDQNDFRIPRVYIRVGSAQFDNTNYVGSRMSYSGRYGGSFPLDDDYATLRRSFWLTTDQAYKSALEAISRKRAALKNVSVSEELADFSPAKQAKDGDELHAGEDRSPAVGYASEGAFLRVSQVPRTARVGGGICCVRRCPPGSYLRRR